ncbi:MAG: hypothetical protein GX131_04450 [candidate division WS1 bacterium]|jgi:hypothetical protein|nr:hypothetical protein [candidate division WS1 bacterium]
MTPLMRAQTTAVMLLLTIFTAAAEPTAAQNYLDRLLTSNVAVVEDLWRYVAFAETAAEALVRDPDGPGASLWLAGDRGFVLEGFNRAGGLMIAKRLTDPEQIAAGDVVLVGSLYGDDVETGALLREIAGRDALAILFAPRASTASVDHLYIDAHAEAPDESELPTASPALAQSLWTFTGELVTAIIRRSGRTPPLFVSVLVPDGRERNAARKGLRWDPQSAEPMAPGIAGRRYLARLANSIRHLRAAEGDAFARAGLMSLDTLGRGGTAWLSVMGHLPPSQVEQVAEDEMPFTLLPGSQPDRVEELVKPGDLVLYVGYYEPIGPWVETVHEAGAEIVTVVSGTPERPASMMGADLNICGCWPYGDALLHLNPPQTGLSMLPPSGVIQSAAVWMLLSENRENRR